MRRIRMIIAYEGTQYVGWQTQPNGISIQETIEKALLDLTGEKIVIHGSGRTDSGVHAAAQVAHFDTDARMPADKFAIALNTHLPRDIRVLYSEECSPQFHARFSAKEKQYGYCLQIGPHADVFLRHTALHLHTLPDFERMERAACDVCGTHDFRAFMSVGTTMDNTIRTVTESAWKQNGSLWTYTVTGTGFLYNQVRILVGTMIEIGTGKRSVTAIADALRSKVRMDAGATAPPHGLKLLRVCYPDFDTKEVLSRES